MAQLAAAMAPPPSLADSLAVARGLAEAAALVAWLSTAELARLLQAITQRQALSDCYSQATTVFEPGTGPPLEAAGEYGRLFTELLTA